MSNKKYRITLTEKQFALIETAVEIMLRTGMGQTYDLAEWLTLKGNDYPHGNGFDIYIAERNLIASVLEGIMRNKAAHNFARINCTVCGASAKEESESLSELTTLYEAMASAMEDSRTRVEWSDGSREPMMCGKEPIPKIERIDE